MEELSTIQKIAVMAMPMVFAIVFHEVAHGWVANRLGDPTARLLGRVSLNPIVHADLIGTIVFPLVSMVSGAMLIGWAKPVPVNTRYLRHPRRDYMLVAAAVGAKTADAVLAFFASRP